MWSVLVVLYLWVVGCAVSSSLPSPVNVVFSSVNLKNVLQWSPGSGTPDGTLFTVKYAIYGDSVKDSKGKQVYWREARHCQKTPYTCCDLSNETWDLEQGYYAKVRAVGSTGGSNWARTVWRFDPLSDTSIGPPVVMVKIEDNSATITITGPMRYQPNNRTPAVSMATIYPQMIYNLSVHNKYNDQINHILLDKNAYTYQMMDYNTEYCFTAKTSVADMPINCHASEEHCVPTPKDPAIAQLLRVVVGIVVPSVCICVLMVICYFLCNYLMGKGRQSPYVLNPPYFHSSPLIIKNETPNIIVILDPECTVELKADRSDLPPTYSSAQSEGSDNLSLVYGVVGVDATREEDEWNEPKDKASSQTCEVGNGCGKKDGRAEGGQAAGFYSHQAKPQLPVISTPIPVWAQTHTQARMWSQLNSGLLAQIEMWREDGDCQGLFLNRNPQNGHFNILQTKNGLAMGNDLEGKVTDVKFEKDADRGSKGEEVPLLSRYAFQNMINMPVCDIPHNDIARLGAVDSEEADADFYDEEEGGGWRLVVPETAVGFNGRGGGEGERGSGDTLRLENVFVRQSSEEAKEAEALRRTGTAGEPESVMDDFINRWKLVIPVDH